MGQKVLVIGSGAREHTIAYTLLKAPSIDEVTVAPGNPGMLKDGIHTTQLSQSNHAALIEFVKNNGYDWVFVGPEVPLIEGIVDDFAAAFIRLEGGIILDFRISWAMHMDTAGDTLILGKKEDAICASFENFAYFNLGYHDYKELGPSEIVFFTPDGVETVSPAKNEMKICSFLWVYYGYPTSSYEGINVEQMRYNCGDMLAKRDNVSADIVAGVPDSGTAHAIGYANRSGIPFARPFIKYTPTWPRSFMPTHQSQREQIAHMKLIPVRELIKDKSMVLIDDSIVRGTQLGQTTQFLYESGAKEVHIRPACPPLLYGCKYLNFSRSKSEMDLITRRVIQKREGTVTEAVLEDYANPDSHNYHEMLDEIGKQLNFTSLRYHRLDDMVASIGLEPCKVCTYCFDGKE